MSPETRLAELGLVLPTPVKPVAAYLPSRRSGNLLFVAGQIPIRDGVLIAKGAVPSQVTMEQAFDCARQCVLNGLANIRAAAGSLGAVHQFLRLGVFVCSDAGFFDQPKVANAASELLVNVFGEAGQHARAAVGSIALPLGSPVEIEFLVELK
ncbi:MAG: RidA family protein [Phycisphaerales bacterium]